MPFQPINFAAIQPQGSPFSRDLVDNLMKGYQAGQMPYQMQRQAEQEQLANAFQKMKNEQEPQKFQTEQQNAAAQRAYQEANTNRLNTMTPVEALQQTLINKYYPQLTQSQINERNAQTNKTNTMVPLESKYQDLINAFYPKEKEAEISQKGAMTNYYNQGGPGQGVGAKEWSHFQNSVSQANPNLSQDQLREAVNAYGSGKTMLSDGTPFNVSADMKNSMDRVVKYGTTTGIINRGVFGAQAESEQPIISNYVKKGLEPYANTTMGYNFDLLKDSMNTKDKDAQKRVGQWIGSNVLGYEASQIQQMLASGKVTVSATEHLLDRNMPKIKETIPVMSDISRKEAIDYVTRAAKEAYEARKKVETGASSLIKQNGNKSTPKKVTFEELEKL